MASRILALIVFTSLSFSMAQFGQTIQYFPQFAIGGIAESHFTVHNPGRDSITVQIDLHRSDGSLFRSEIVDVAAGASVNLVFSNPASELVVGWAKLSSDQAFTASLFYQIEGVGNVGVSPSNRAQQFKVFNSTGDGTQTGFAVANPDLENPTNVSFEIFDEAGQLERAGSLDTLGPGGHRAIFFDRPPFLAMSSGTVELKSTHPVVAVALRLDPEGAGFLLASVPVILPGLPIRGELNDVSRNIIGGSSSNLVAPPDNIIGPGPSGDSTEMPLVVGATISGGGSADSRLTNREGESGSIFSCLEADTGAPVPCINQVMDNFGTVGGGAGNTVGRVGSTVAGGVSNLASERLATVSGGLLNVAGGEFSTVGGGIQNSTTGLFSTVGGGDLNRATGSFSAVGGGHLNFALGEGSTVPGGRDNSALGDLSFAAGNNSKAEHNGTFVWSDTSSPFPFTSTGANQFLIQAGGGVGINTNDTPRSLTVKGLGDNSELIGLKDNVDQEKWHLNLKSGGMNFVETGEADFRLFLKEGGNVGIGTSNPQGKLDVNGALFVNGAIFQRGARLHADYVFEDDYPLESIEEHSEFMWREKHLPGVAPAQKNEEGQEIVEFGARSRGTLEELEKAHIYIEQLNDRIKGLEAQLAQIREMIASQANN